ncbi:ATP-binding cassette domain-containing protein [Dehalobacter sp. DCM]|uniref:ABC transporter ATP-binding protein n=1 Tax=Dehalobacter sp. DCM TaxID=2907827 RepID=UPI00308144EB|nr:ATP-binding cassette domain-containing protein [Dehalobacter sp. DCM]
MLELKNVALNLEGDQGEVDILKDISLALEKKKIYVMTGPNGGGKSSIAKVIMGIYRASAGKLLLDGVDITDMGITERARLGIGYAFQSPPRFKGMKVKDMLKLASGDRKINPCDLLYDVGLCAQDYLEREINASFSGGELKRVEIASILARNLKVAVFDEPEAGIDLWSFQKLTETFQTLNKKYDMTIVIISHQERILRLADQVVLVSDGKISEITTKAKILGEIEMLDSGCECRNNCSIVGGNVDAYCNR